VDDRHLSAGESAYEAGDWHRAALEFMAAVHGDPALGSGHALHHAGNALVKLSRYADAVAVYLRATEDTSYERRGSVFANLGAALAALGRHDEAVDAYDKALADAAYATPYKALLGRAGALFALGRYEDAAGSYRQAAWAEGNPDPGRALNNLGLAFMAVGKPEDAVEAFKAALGIESYAAKGKASANLALAYSAMGFYEEAVREFEVARDVFGHVLTGATLDTYESCLAKARPSGDAAVTAPPAEDLERETVEGWSTGELSAAPAPVEDASGLPDDGEEATARFFAITEQEMRDADRAARKAERKAKRTPRAIVLRVLGAVLVVVLVAGGAGGALYLGYGYPTQEQTVSGLMDAYRSGQPYTDFWVAVPQADVKQEMRALPAKFASYRISGVDRAVAHSTALVIVTLDSGTTLSYDIQLAREGVGWKVVGVKNRWSSTTS
jgi:tetratricopeptide (TPR) repeat protein